MTGRELERLTIHRLDWESKRGRCHAGRYGVQAVLLDGEWRPLDSLPDIEGVLPGGRQFLFDCKVTSEASFPLNDDKLKARQLRHLLRRAEMGAVAFLLLHYNARALKTKSEPALTVAFPVDGRHVFWEAFDRGEVKRIARQDAQQYGALVAWNAPERMKTPTPDVLAAVWELAGMVRA